MGFKYDSSTAEDIVDWFGKFQTFITGTGWNIASGSGVYFYLMEAGSFRAMRKMLLVK